MKIAMVGAGYVGLVTGACFAEFGFDVTCIDKDQQKIENLKKGILPIYEPGLESLVSQTQKAERLCFTANLEGTVSKADIVFIAVGTPTHKDGAQADLSAVFTVAESIAKAIDGYTIVVTKSTVPVGTGEKIKSLIQHLRPDLKAGKDFDVASNPEFLREGSAISDFMRPDRVVIGTAAGEKSDRARAVLQKLYRPLYLIETPIVMCDTPTAELAKYAANGFLATKISFINEMADICEKAGANVQDIAKAIGLDGRIGRKFLHAGPGYGGSCFPKDTRALAQTAQELGASTSIVEAVIRSNDQRKLSMVDKIKEVLGGSLQGKSIAVLGLTFKPNTDDMREAPSLTIVPALQKEGAALRVYDPVGMEEAGKFFTDLTWCKGPYEAAKGCDAVVILTEWNEFRALDFEKLYQALAQPFMIDLRNIYKADEVTAAGFDYISIGRKPIKAAQEKTQKKATAA